MNDLDAIRARHTPLPMMEDAANERWDICSRDEGIWPCDTAIVLAALDAERDKWDHLSARIIETENERDAALERERQLREAAVALDRAYGAVPLGGMSEMTKERLKAWARLQDAAETPEETSGKATLTIRNLDADVAVATMVDLRHLPEFGQATFEVTTPSEGEHA